MLGSSSERSGVAATIRRAQEKDLSKIAQIGSLSFSGLRPVERGEQWVQACWQAAPRFSYWVAEVLGDVVAYILWQEKGGFRRDAVIELEQIATQPDMRGRGIGTDLVTRSLAGLEEELKARGSRLKLVEVTTGTEQQAIDFYRRTLRAEVVCQIPDFFRGDECVLIARR